MFTAPPSFATRPLSKVRSSEEWHKKLMLINVQMVNAAGTEQQRALVPRIPTARCLLSPLPVRHFLHFIPALPLLLFLLLHAAVSLSVCLSVSLCILQSKYL